jgi:copper chaperone NosL
MNGFWILDFKFWMGRILSLFGVLLLAGCAAGAASEEPQPPEIAYGLDACDVCGMIISDARFAAATLLTNGETRQFDDIGNMVIYQMDHPELAVEAWFVHDYQTEEWLRGEAAYFVMAPQIYSPMGHGVAAFADEDEAQALAQEYGSEVLSLDGVRAAVHVLVHG